MWKYVRRNGYDSPMAEILNSCSCSSNLRLIIYDLSANRVECATVNKNQVPKFGLDCCVVSKIKEDAIGGSHAILAFDVCCNNVYLIDSVPELPAASAVMLCVATELLNGDVESRTNGRPCQCDEFNDDEYDEFDSFMDKCEDYGNRMAMDMPKKCVDRDSRGRFTKAKVSEEACKVPDSGENFKLNRRFRLSRH